jgi:hypothetical protein
MAASRLSWDSVRWIQSCRLLRCVTVELGCSLDVFGTSVALLDRVVHVSDWPGPAGALDLGPDAWKTALGGSSSPGLAKSETVPDEACALTLACFVLASKSCEQPRRLRDVVNALDFYLDPSSMPSLFDGDYSARKAQICQFESVILRLVCFDMRVLTSDPFRRVRDACGKRGVGLELLSLASMVLADGVFTLRIGLEHLVPGASDPPATSTSLGECVATASLLSAVCLLERTPLAALAKRIAPSKQLRHGGLPGPVEISDLSLAIAEQFLSVLGTGNQDSRSTSIPGFDSRGALDP